MTQQTNKSIFTVSRLNAEVRLLLENEMGIVWLVGEISNFSAPISGHWYFSLKDARAQVKCAMFKGNNRRVSFKPKAGQQVLVKARLSLYEPRGDYQIIVDSMQPEGDGLLQQKFDELKMKLASEGVFAQALKQDLPDYPKTVGVITSSTGAALYDILHVLKRRDPSLHVIIYPTVVQGDRASIEIAQAIGRANERRECDVLIVGRGGGSLEDLWCFNEEIVARTIAASQIPIISAVGHEVDVTIADYVADVRAPTPSAAAEIISRDHAHQIQHLTHHVHRLTAAIQNRMAANKEQQQHFLYKLEKNHPSYRLSQQSQQVDDYTGRLSRAILKQINHQQFNLQHKTAQLNRHSPAQYIAERQQHRDLLTYRLKQSMQKKLMNSSHQFLRLTEILDTVSPLSTLNRGYSITLNNKGKALTSAHDVKQGDEIETKLENGTLRSVVL
ncbi:exodeoxyribonuclease VII large subunit [Vibrio sp.]|nr:exodeoxyribonuclease VII large subunit [Vibrio sp.]